MKNALCLCGLILLCGCTAGSRCLVTVRSVAEPVSCTPAVFGSDGRIRTVRTNEVVRHIELNKCNVSVFWRIIPLSRYEWDLSSQIKAHLQETSGNAVVNVTVKTTSCDGFHWFIATIVPIIPTYVKVTVEADVVKMAEPVPGS